jgi:hypothetical protein
MSSMMKHVSKATEGIGRFARATAFALCSLTLAATGAAAASSTPQIAQVQPLQQQKLAPAQQQLQQNQLRLQQPLQLQNQQQQGQQHLQQEQQHLMQQQQQQLQQQSQPPVQLHP